MSKKKVISLTIAIFAILVVSASIISFSIANFGSGETSGTASETNNTNASSDYITNIDLIIQTMNEGEKYKIVEIIPNGASASDLSKYATEGGFASYVLQANATQAGITVPANMIQYDCITVNKDTVLQVNDELNETGLLLDAADLIYVSSPTKNSYDGANNMSDDVFSFLQQYARGKDKPIIMDIPTGSTGDGSKPISELVETISRNHIKFRTFSWNAEDDALTFFGGKTYYLKYSTKNNPTGKVLVITNDAANASMMNKMKACDEGDLKSAAYIGKGMSGVDMEYVTVSPSELTIDSFDGYDFILIENDVKSVNISSAIYNKIKALSESSRYIFYDSRLLDKTSDTITVTNNYYKLLNYLVNNSGVAKYSNVLPISYGYFTSLYTQGAEGISGAKAIADIINYGDFRGSGSRGKKGKIYRVLELQPCYPIDLELAQSREDGTGKQYKNDIDAKGNYYQNPSDIIFGVTKDEVEDGMDYYAFELSKAKIAHALGINIDQIEVDQMSTNEFISSKEVVLETYDLVYIGGNKSALTLGKNKEFSTYTYVQDKLMKLMTSFDMYTHTGNLVELDTDGSVSDAIKNKIKNTPGQTDEYPYGQIFINGEAQITYVEQNGNDINKIKYDELKAYVNAGMPIIVESKVAQAFEDSKALEGNRLNQLSLKEIDPDSWMYKTLDYIYGFNGKASVGWGIDAVDNQITIENEDREYGDTLGTDVTVFSEAVESKIDAVWDAGNKRPTLTVEDAPLEYVEGNPNSYNQMQPSVNGVNNSFQITGYVKPNQATPENNKFTLTLYIDVDGNGIFSDGSINGTGEVAQIQEYTYSETKEKIDPNGGEVESNYKTVPKKITMSYKSLDDDFYGLLSWKLVAKEKETGLVSTVTGYSYFDKADDAEKKQIEILQIMPRPESKKIAYETSIAQNSSLLQSTENDGHSLYLCTECQLYMYRTDYNVLAVEQGGNIGRVTYGGVKSYQGVNLGKHEHKFGIVKYDTAIEDEDWENNLATKIVGINGDYEADIDIMYADEFEELVAQVQKSSDEDREEYAVQRDHYKTIYESYEKAFAGEDEETQASPQYKAKKALYDYLVSDSMKQYKMSSYFQEWADNGEFYKVWMYNLFGTNLQNGGSSMDNLLKYRTLYNTYIGYYNEMVTAKEQYRYYRRLSYTADKWMAENYTMVVLGFAEDFGGEDLNKDACQMIADYVKKGGSMLNTHDSTTKYEKAGAMNITSELRELFGMDRYHVTAVKGTDTGSADTTARTSTATVRIPSYKYTQDVESPVDARYQIQIKVPGYTDTKEFTVGASENKEIVWNRRYRVWGSYANSWDEKSSFSETVVSGDITKVRLTIQASATWESQTDFADVSGTDVGLYKYVNYNWVPVTDAAGNTLSYTLTCDRDSEGNPTSATIEFDVPRATQVTEGLMTKAFSDQIFTVSNKDVSIDVGTVPSTSATDGTFTVTDGTEHSDISENMTITVKLNPPANTPENYPAGSTPKSFEGCNVTIAYNSRVYTRAANADGVVTFELEQLPSSDLHNISADSLKYRKFTTADETLYYFTERTIYENDDTAGWNQMMATTSDEGIAAAWKAFGYNSPVGVTDTFTMYNTSQRNTAPYRYIEYIYQNAITWDMGYGVSSDKVGYGPNGASQVNEGIVTVYPYNISSELRIATTHAQTYALDMEDKDVSVWYTLSAGTNATKLGASYFAATPHDGMNNYYLYSKGNVFYCGAGHSMVTGPGRDNNDERKLFINVIVNSVRNANMKPVITLHEKDTEGAEVEYNKKTGNLRVDGDGKYTYIVNETDDIPEFDFKVRTDPKVDLAEVMVYYDLNYGIIDSSAPDQTAEKDYAYADNYTADGNHVLIAKYNVPNAPVLASEQLAELRYDPDKKKGYEKLKLKDEYFNPYGGSYTYLVIKATDTKGNVSYQRLKISWVRKLFDLTYNESNNTYFMTMYLTDVSDRKQFNI
ncbi:MAG: DUF5057 domain-containing protein [Lachnospiraceae bacterium]